MSRPVRSTVLVALCVLGLVAVAPACSDTGSDSGSDTSSTTSTEPTTTEPTSTTTSPDEGPLFFPSGEEAMAHLIDAWKAGDRATALRGASEDAVDSLFLAPPEGYEKYGACGSAEFGQQMCTYRNRSAGGFINFQMAEEPQGWIVEGTVVDQAG
jgi:hypothetical protein